MTIWFARWFKEAGSLHRFGQATLLFYICALVMVASLTLGGGGRIGYFSDVVLQLSAIPLLIFALWTMFEASLTKQMRTAMLFCSAIAVVPFIQLIPLPPWLWTALPNRDLSQAPFAILAHDVSWMPISVSPYKTWLSALSLLPPLAIFSGTVLLSYRARRLLTLIILVVGVLSVFVALMQVVYGGNNSEATGFFVNRSHLAAFLYSVTLFAIAWTLHAASVAGTASSPTQHDTASIVVLIGGFTVVVILLAGEAMTRSRAGLGLTIAALLGAVALGFSVQRVGARSTFKKMLFGAITLAMTFTAQVALYRIMDRFATDQLQDDRSTFARRTIEAARAYMPIGSGLGTFVPVYAMFEKPEDITVPNSYVNHAHNDALELWLETGVVGLALMGIFVIWFVLRSVEVWRRAPPVVALEIDWSLARAATIVVPLLIAHSLVEFPLRTGAIMAIMAFACALLIEPPVGTEDALESQGLLKRARKLGWPEPATSLALSRRQSAPALRSKSSTVPPRAVGERWGSNIEWPAEWRKSSDPQSPMSPKK